MKKLEDKTLHSSNKWVHISDKLHYNNMSMLFV